MIRGICPKCHSMNQLELVMDNGWELHCLICGNILKVSSVSGDTKELRRRYEVEPSTFQSPDTVRCTRYNTIPMFAGLMKGIR